MTTPESPPPSTPPSPRPATPPEVRLSTVVGDRLCIKCSFNLSGQPVFRENVYGMAVVRCPECSTLASLQEYPLLGKWAGRLAAMLAAAWLLVLIGGTFGSAGIMFGLTQGTIHQGSFRLAEHIAKKHADWYNNQASETEKARLRTSMGGQVYLTGPYVWIDGIWWSSQDPKAFIAELGGLRGAVSWDIAQTYFWNALAAFILGILWSVFLLNLKRHRLMVFALLPIGIACGIALIANTSQSRMTMAWGARGNVYAINEASSILWPSLVTISLGTCLVTMWIGLMLGRPIVRSLARLLLPPRMLGSLAYLWIAEGKRPPRPPKAATVPPTRPVPPG